MSKSWNRMETWLALMVLGAGGILLLVGGLWIHASATATPIHPESQAVPSTAGAAPPAAWAGAVERGREVVRAGLIEQNLPGVSVAVGIGGNIVWAEGFGWASIEKREPVTPSTRFRIGTASKMFTSAGVGLLLEEHRLELDREIQAYVPEYPKKQWPVTLRQLMGHVAGIRQDAGDEEPVRVRCDGTLGALDRFAGSDLRFEPRTRYQYSNYGWVLVSAAIETATGERYFDFIRKRVFEPLGMNDTEADGTEEPLRNLAHYYFPRFAADPRYGPQEPEDVDLSCMAGSSAFTSSASDVVRFVMAVNGGTLLQRETVRLLQTPQQLVSGDETGYGLGWDVETVTIGGKTAPVVGYDGALRGGLVMSALTVPDTGVVVAVLSNISHADTPSLAAKLAEAFTR